MTPPASSRPLWVALALSVVLALPGMRLPPVHDDLIHLMVIEGRAAGYTVGPAGLYDFVSKDSMQVSRTRGFLPWWTDERLSLRFFRPVPSWLLYADHDVFGGASWAAHLHSLAWMLLLCVVAWRLLSRLLTPRVAAVAMVVYAAAGAHAEAVSWPAARYALLAAVFALTAVTEHLGPRRWLAPVCLAAGLACGEGALGGAALIGAYELFGRRGEPLAARAVRLAPVAAVAIVYLAGYAALGFGARHSGVYIDPMASPLAYLAAAATRLPVVAGEVLASVPSMIAFAVPEILPVLVGIGLVSCALAAAAWWRWRHLVDARDRAALGWLVPGAVAAVLPGLAAPLGGRLLPIALAGTATLVAVLGIAARERLRAATGASRVGLALMLGIAVLTHLGLAPLLRIGVPLALATQAAEEQRIGREAEICTGHALVLNAADPAVAVYALSTRLLAGLPTAERIHVLSMARQPLRVENVEAHGFDLVVVGERLPHDWERLYRAAPWRSGEVFTVDDFSVTVIDASPVGPRHLRVRFDEPIAGAPVCFLSWQGGRLRQVDLPAPGATLELPHELGPMNR